MHIIPAYIDDLSQILQDDISEYLRPKQLGAVVCRVKSVINFKEHYKCQIVSIGGNIDTSLNEVFCI